MNQSFAAGPGVPSSDGNQQQQADHHMQPSYPQTPGGRSAYGPEMMVSSNAYMNHSRTHSNASLASLYMDQSRSYGNYQDFSSLQPLMSTPNHPGVARMPSAQYPSMGPMSMYPQPSAAMSNPAMAAYQQWMVQYSQWWHYVENQRRQAMRQLTPVSERPRLTPHRFPHRHTRVAFGSLNQLIVTNQLTVTIQQLDPSLIDIGEDVQVSTYPGPLLKGETKREDVVEYIRVRESALRHVRSDDPLKNDEKFQIWSLLSMLIRQNGVVSGADISEQLLLNNESEFISSDDDSDLGKLRRYLILGQRKTALEFATKSGLWGHAFSLTHFSTGTSQHQSDSNNQQMSQMVTKFMNVTLNRDDPIFVLFRCLSQKHNQSIPKGPVVKNQKVIPAENLKQFAILLANDCDVVPLISNSGRPSELMKFIVAIKNNTSQSLVNVCALDPDAELDERGAPLLKFSEELVFLNEIWEFTRNHREFIESLVPFKLMLAARLFDYGLLDQTSRYCYAIRQSHLYYSHYFPGKSVRDSSLDWKSILNMVTDIECRIYGFDVTSQESASSSQNKKIHDTEVRDGRNRNESPDDPTEDDDDEEDEDETDEYEDDSRRSLSPMKPQQASVTSVPSGPGTKSLKDPIDTVDHQVPEPLSPVKKTQRTMSINSVTGGQRVRVPSESKETSPVTPLDAPPVTKLNKILPHASSGATFLSSSHPSKSDDPPLKSQVASSVPMFIPPAPSDVNQASEFSFLSQPLASNDPNINGQGYQHDVSASNGIEQHNDAGDNNYQQDMTLDDPKSPPQFLPPFNSTAAAVGNSSHVGFPNAFSPIPSSPEPMSQMSGGMGNNSMRQHVPHTLNGDQKNPSTEAIKSTEANKGGKNWLGLGNLLAKVVPKGPPQAVLPDDSDKSLVWSEEHKRWIDKNDPNSGSQMMDAISNGPPKIPLANVSFNTAPLSNNRQNQPPPVSQLTSQPPLRSSVSLMNLPTGGGQQPNSFSYVKKNRPQYVDLWQQQQQKNTT